MQKRDRFDLETFFGNVGQQREDTIRMLGQVSGELLEARFSRLEQTFAHQNAGLPAECGGLMGAQVNQSAGFHCSGLDLADDVVYRAKHGKHDPS